MVSIVTKTIKGNEYLYLVASERNGDKIIQKTVKYIGRKRPIPMCEFRTMEYSYSKKDWVLTESIDLLSYQDHEKLKDASKKHMEHLSTLDKISREKERENFLSVFIANSNAIEGSTLTQKDTFNLLFNDITPSGHGSKELFMALNLKKAWDFLEQNQKRFPTLRDMLVLHSLVNKDIESIETLGKLKNVQNYVGEEMTSSYLFTEERMDELFTWLKEAYLKINDFEAAFQSHAQFEIIHPFIDGNGRVGRLLLNWLLMHKKIAPIAIPVRRREEYLSALVNAQRGKIEVICIFMRDVYLEYYSFA